MVTSRQKRKCVLRKAGTALVTIAVLVLSVSACGKPGDGEGTLTVTPIPTEAPEITENAKPMEEAKATPRPTVTPKPTKTPAPTKAPESLPENNMISNGTFDSAISGWGLYKESGGEGSLSVADGKLALNITSLGRLNYAVQMYPDEIMTLEQGKEYRVRFEISSTENRSIEAMIQQNGGNYQSYTWKKVEIKPEPQTIDYIFTMTSPSDTNTKLVFNCGTQGKDMAEHTIYLDNVAVFAVDDTGDWKNPVAYEPAIRVNQVGYRPDSKKMAVFSDIAGVTEFSVINAKTEAVVYIGAVTGEKYTKAADEVNSLGDFSEVKEAGRYYISCGDVKSHEFYIGTSVYDDMLVDLVRMFYLQRCGCEVADNTFGHVACHDGQAKIYGTEEYIDVTGGWHDAGDYGRYIVPAAKSVADLLYAYEAMENPYNDAIGIPESGNGIPDILDEVRYELEWMLKMQAEDGGVYHKVSCASFCGYIMPEKETGQLFATPVSTTATGDFCASMALAYEFYYDIDRDFAADCLAAAEKAWAFLEANPNLIFKNPSDITTGSYEDGSDKDERYWAAAQMYRATKDAKYLSALETMAVKTGLDWSTVGDYGNIALVTMKDIDKESQVYTKAYNSIVNQADRYEMTTSANAYGTANTSFHWGSNMAVSNSGVILGLAYNLTGNQKYLTTAESNLHYLLGTNPVGTCFVTGHGTVAPQNPHHRPSIAMKQAAPGMLVGGTNSGLQDPTAKARLKDVPAWKCYIDNKESYSTNEITIYWNSPLIYLLALTESRTH